MSFLFPIFGVSKQGILEFLAIIINLRLKIFNYENHYTYCVSIYF